MTPRILALPWRERHRHARRTPTQRCRSQGSLCLHRDCAEACLLSSLHTHRLHRTLTWCPLEALHRHPPLSGRRPQGFEQTSWLATVSRRSSAGSQTAQQACVRPLSLFCTPRSCKPGRIRSERSTGCWPGRSPQLHAPLCGHRHRTAAS